MKHGDSITITNRLRRRSGKVKNSHKDYKFWHVDQIKPIQGIFLGHRTISEGTREFNEEYIEYLPQKYIKVSLVSINAKENPFYTITNLD